MHGLRCCVIYYRAIDNIVNFYLSIFLNLHFNQSSSHWIEAKWSNSDRVDRLRLYLAGLIMIPNLLSKFQVSVFISSQLWLTLTDTDKHTQTHAHIFCYCTNIKQKMKVAFFLFEEKWATMSTYKGHKSLVSDVEIRIFHASLIWITSKRTQRIKFYPSFLFRLGERTLAG